MEFGNKEWRIEKKKKEQSSECAWAQCPSARPNSRACLLHPRGPSPPLPAARAVTLACGPHCPVTQLTHRSLPRGTPVSAPPPSTNCSEHGARADSAKLVGATRPRPRSYRSGTRSVSFPSSFYPRDPRPTPPVPSDNPTAIVAV
jgi:hypothetical protein